MDKTQPQNTVVISKETKNKVARAKCYSDKILYFTNKSVDQMLKLQDKLSKHAGVWLAKAGNYFYDPTKPNPKMEFLKEVAQNTIVASVEVLTSMDNAAIVLGRAFGESSVDVIKYRYGNDAAEVVHTGS